MLAATKPRNSGATVALKQSHFHLRTVSDKEEIHFDGKRARLFVEIAALQGFSIQVKREGRHPFNICSVRVMFWNGAGKLTVTVWDSLEMYDVCDAAVLRPVGTHIVAVPTSMIVPLPGTKSMNVTRSLSCIRIARNV